MPGTWVHGGHIAVSDADEAFSIAEGIVVLCVHSVDLGPLLFKQYLKSLGEPKIEEQKTCVKLHRS